MSQNLEYLRSVPKKNATFGPFKQFSSQNTAIF